MSVEEGGEGRADRDQKKARQNIAGHAKSIPQWQQWMSSLTLMREKDKRSGVVRVF